MQINENQKAYSDTTTEQREEMHRLIDIDKIRKSMENYDNMANTGEYKRSDMLMTHQKRHLRVLSYES